MKARYFAPAACWLALGVLFHCGPSDPRERILEERERWKVSTLGQWAMSQDGAITLNLRVSGPVQSELEQLTVRVLFQDATGNTLAHEWRTLDLSGIQRGGPEDILLRLQAPAGASVEGIGVDTVPVPAPEDIPHIEELQF
jgi:hypothetical protein